MNLFTYKRISGFRYQRGPLFKLSYSAGSDQWRASLHLEHRWFGRRDCWHILFLPW